MSEYISKDLRKYYKEQYKKHGKSGQGVGWHNEELGYYRYETVLDMLPDDGSTILEYGCGNGIYSNALLIGNPRNYIGVEPLDFYYKDLVEKNNTNKRRYLNLSIEEFNDLCDKHDDFALEYRHDWAVGIGLFGLRLEHTDEEFKIMIDRCLEYMLKNARRGIIFNAHQSVTSYTNPEQFYFKLDELIKTLYCLGYSKFNLLSKPDNNPYEFFIRIFK